MGDDSTLFGKTFDVLSFFRQKRLGDKEREIGVFVTCFFQHAVQGIAQFLPQGISIGTDDHRTAHWRVVCQLCASYNIDVPLGVIFGAGRDSVSHSI